MRIETLWSAMETEARSSTGWLSRIAVPDPAAYPVLVAVDQVSGSRALLIPATTSALPPRPTWPECSGLELAARPVGGKPHFCVLLRDRRAADVFAVLADQLVSAVAPAKNEESAVAALFDRLGAWQTFLSVVREGLGPERQRGLFGELHVLRTHLIPRAGAKLAITSWKGSRSSHQDFQLPGGALEVKASAAKQPSTITISSERQLDDTGVGTLGLHVVHVDERDVAPQEGVPGESLPYLIEQLRGHAASGGMVKDLDDKLLAAGWVDAHAARYAARRWTVRAERSFQVKPGFPRILERDLLGGVGRVKYELELSACTRFEAPLETLLELLLQAPTSAGALP